MAAVGGMPEPFDSGRIVALGWRQGAVLGETLASRAAERAPTATSNCPSDSLIVTSHDCDIANPSLDKEPVGVPGSAIVAAGPEHDELPRRLMALNAETGERGAVRMTLPADFVDAHRRPQLACRHGSQHRRIVEAALRIRSGHP